MQSNVGETTTFIIPTTKPIKLETSIINDKINSGIVISLLSKINDDNMVIKYATTLNIVTIKNKFFLTLHCLIFKTSPPR
jgi:hypothetical protein